MFEKNLKALSIKNSLLANQLRNTDYNNISVIESQSGDINIEFNNIALHNTINPIEEAQNIFATKIKDNHKNTFHIIYGLGLGYLFKRAYVSAQGKIILFEPFLDVLRFTLQYVDFSQEIENNRVFICTSLDEIISILNKKHITGDTIEISCLPSYMKLNPGNLENLTEQLVDLLENKKQDQNTILKKSYEWGLSTIKNLKEISSSLPIDYLSGVFENTPVIIASAGPSLAKHINYLKTHRDKYLLITVNSALKTLLKNNIIPDFCVISEHVMIDKQFDQLQNLDKINYILHPRAQNYCWHLNKNNFIYLTNTDSFTNWYNSKLEKNYNGWPSAGSVSILAFYFAAMALKSKTIILTGQDLAFSEEKMYSSKPFENMFVKIENNRLIAKLNNNGVISNLYNIELKKVKDKDGNELLTRADYFQYIKQYEDIISNEISPEINVINTSLSGTYIEGMNYDSMKNILESLEKPKKPYSSIIEQIFNENTDIINKNKEILTLKFNKFFEDTQNYLILSEKLLKIIDNFNTYYSKSATHKDLPKIIQKFYSQRKNIFNFISSETIVSFMLQKSQLDLTNNYIIPQANESLKIQDYKSNIEAEEKFLKDLINTLKEINNHNVFN